MILWLPGKFWWSYLGSLMSLQSDESLSGTEMSKMVSFTCQGSWAASKLECLSFQTCSLSFSCKQGWASHMMVVSGFQDAEGERPVKT